jgi:hypothetical protein
MKIDFTKLKSMSGFNTDHGLPLNELELVAGEKAVSMAKNSPSIMDAWKSFSSTLTYYGVPYYKHKDLAHVFLFPLYE